MFKKLLICVAFILLGTLTTHLFSANIVINEILASNYEGITDKDGDSSDWIELYNAGTEPVNLNGWGLSDHPNNPFKWTFPDYTMQPGSYLIVWASGKNIARPNTQLHTNFSISSQGEFIHLTCPVNGTIDRIPPVPLTGDVSFGRLPDNPTELRFFSTPTPGGANTTESFLEILTPVEFTYESGFYTESFTVSLSHTDPDVIIIYTLDGSDPELENVDGDHAYRKSFIYSESIEIKSRKGEPNLFSEIPTTNLKFGWYPDWKSPDGEVFKANVVRAKAFKSGAIAAKTATRTFIVDQNAAELYSGMPVISLVSDYNHLFHPETGIYVPGVNPQFFEDQNFTKGWRRRADITFFETDRNIAFSDIYEIRNKGNSSLGAAQKSLDMIARSALGSDMINYPVYKGTNSRASQLESFKRLSIRAWGSAVGDIKYPIFSDAIQTMMVEGSDLELQAYRPCVVFINGEYWGLHELRESSKNSWYYQSHFGIDRDNPGYDLIDRNNLSVADEGDTSHWIKVYLFYRNNDLSVDANYERIKEWVDVQNLIEYVVHCMYSDKRDWPINNEYKWRPRTQNGKWRWTQFDLDAGLSPWGEYEVPDMVTWMMDGNYNHIFVFLMANKQFREQFFNTYADWLNSYFVNERAVAIFYQVKEELDPFMPEYAKRWNLGINWEANNKDALKRLEARPEKQLNNLCNYFNLTPIELTVNSNIETAGDVHVNSIVLGKLNPELNPYPWKGTYFKDVPVKIKAVARPGYKFLHWTGDLQSDTPEIVIVPTKNMNIVAVYEPSGIPTDIYYWMMDGNIQNDFPHTVLYSTYAVSNNPGILQFTSSLGNGYPFNPSHSLWRKGSMERRNAPTSINYIPEMNNGLLFGESGMRGLQFKQPFRFEENEHMVEFRFSTMNYKDIEMRFAAIDEGAAQWISVKYFDPIAEAWINDELADSILMLTNSYQLLSLNFSAISLANNNPDFRVRLGFGGSNMFADSGNRVTFNNISVSGIVSNPGSPPDEGGGITGFPIPAREYMHVRSDQGLLTGKQYQIYDLTGRVVQTGMFIDEASPIDLIQLNKGIYLLVIENHRTFRIIKQ